MTRIDVIGLDHIYVPVSDMTRAVAFYDPVMELLGFKRGTKPIAGEPHVHYFNQVMQYTIRPARGDDAHDAYRVGSVHHLCFRVRDRGAVDAAHRGLCSLGIEASEPRIYEYREDYYATFFADPDGTRLEIVSDTALRRVVRGRWQELVAFENPVSRLPEVEPPASRGNLGEDIPETLADELVEVLAASADVRVERIVSRGHASPPDFWYDQHEHELVIVTQGNARLELQGDSDVELGPGDWIHLRPHQRHRVAWTIAHTDTIWLAVFWPA